MNITMKGKFEHDEGVKFFRVKRPDLSKAKAGEVTYPVGYHYNGGIIVNGIWVKGFKVARPKLPKGMKLQNIGVGLQLNARPPYATSVLVKA